MFSRVAALSRSFLEFYQKKLLIIVESSSSENFQSIADLVHKLQNMEEKYNEIILHKNMENVSCGKFQRIVDCRLNYNRRWQV